MAIPRVPKFNDRLPAYSVSNELGNFVEQGGHLFSHATFDRFCRKWLPPPVYVAPPEKSGCTVEAEILLDQVRGMIARLQLLEPILAAYLEKGCFEHDPVGMCRMSKAEFDRLKTGFDQIKEENS